MADELADFFVKLNVCFSEKNSNDCKWSDAKYLFEGLKMKVKDMDSRTKISLSQITQTKSVLQCCVQLLEENQVNVNGLPGGCLPTIAESMRFLRNTSAGVENNQENIVSSGVIEQVNAITSILIKPAYQESNINDKVNEAIKSGIQLLGNVVVGNTQTQDYVWRQCFPEFFLSVMTSVNYEIQNFVCMVIYNCLSSQRRKDLVSCPNGLKIMSQILHLCADHENLEWGYFILEAFVANGHVGDLYQGMEFDPSARIVLLDIIQVHLTGEKSWEILPENQSNKPIGCDIPGDSLIFLSQEFEIKSNMISKDEEIDFHSAENMMDALLMTRLLKLLATAVAIKPSTLQSREQLLDTAVELLHQTNHPINREQFSNVTSAPQCQDSGELSPSHGFKRDLVRLIGNMCYKHRNNQDMVREKEGIPLILDHCNIDDHNPYICQWAVFTLRNLFQDNSENQQIVASLDKRGVADNSRLHQFGIDVEKTVDGKAKLVRKE